MKKDLIIEVVLIIAIAFISIALIKTNNTVNDLEIQAVEHESLVEYYEGDYTLELLDNYNYVFGRIRTKRNDINYWTYRVEIYNNEPIEDIYIHIDTEFDYEINVVLFYLDNKLVYVKQIN